MAESRGLLRIVTPDELTEHEASQIALRTPQKEQEIPLDNLAKHVSDKFYEFSSWQQTSGLRDRLMNALRTYNGEYGPEKLQEIRKFGGSEVFSRMTAIKCRGATAMLRDVYLAPERPWKVEPTPDPVVPGNIMASIMQLVQIEALTLQQSGQAVTDDMLAERVRMLQGAAERASLKQAAQDAARTTVKLDDILTEGRFYEAFSDFLLDLPIFPFAVIKGPVVRRTLDVKWGPGGVPATVEIPRMFWERVSPFDLYWSPWAMTIDQAELIEHTRLTRADLTQLIGVPGWREPAIRAVLEHYQYGESPGSWLVPQEAQRGDQENRRTHLTSLIDVLEYHGYAPGQLLLDYDFPAEDVPDPLMEYSIQAWVCDRWVLKVILNPLPSRAHPYYVSSFEKVPGAVAGRGLPEILWDVQEVANASLRALTNNMAMASGPQVVVNVQRMAETENPAEMYPWKRWFVTDDMVATGMSSSGGPIGFFQPQSNAAELMGIYEKMTQIADEVSAIPRYMTGSERIGGAGRTASGLAMLMGNASKVLQAIAGSIDKDILEQSLQRLYDFVMLTDGGATLRGDEAIVVRGVAVAVQKETERMRQLEFLQLTGNPIDLSIIGIPGRAAVLREVAKTLGLAGEEIVPQQQILEAMAQGQQLTQTGGGGGVPGGPSAVPAAAPGQPAPSEEQNMMRGPSGA